MELLDRTAAVEAMRDWLRSQGLEGWRFKAPEIVEVVVEGLSDEILGLRCEIGHLQDQLASLAPHM